MEDVLVMELKCLNYLRASGRSVCLPANFQRPKFEWRRIVDHFEAVD
jgi:hypothetical protein